MYIVHMYIFIVMELNKIKVQGNSEKCTKKIILGFNFITNINICKFTLKNIFD